MIRTVERLPDGSDRKTKFGLIISGYELARSIELGILAEKFHFDSVWVPDHLIGILYTKGLRGSMLDPWVTLTAIGVQTRKIFLCSAVTDGIRAHPAKLAQIVSTLDELTGGRAGLGIGAGEAMNILPFGMEWSNSTARAERLREAVVLIELLWASSRSKPANYEGKYYHLRDAFLEQSFVRTPHPPIYIGALGSSLTLAITGELADGWFPYLNTPTLYAKKIQKIKEHAEHAGRSIEDLDTVAWLDVLLSNDPEELDSAVQKTKLLLAIELNAVRSLGYDMAIPAEYSLQKVLSLDTERVCTDAESSRLLEEYQTV